MADTVNTNVVFAGNHRYIVHFSNISDGTGEAAVKKVDISTLIEGTNNAAPSSVTIEKIQFACDGMKVRIDWDHTTNDLACVLSGHHTLVWGENGLADPKSAGGTGDILFTTIGASINDTYDVTLHLKLET